MIQLPPDWWITRSGITATRSSLRLTGWKVLEKRKANHLTSCHRLRTEPATSKIKILMFSAKTQDIDRDTGMKVGADDYLTKPAAPAEIVSRVEKLLAAKITQPSNQQKVSGKG